MRMYNPKTVASPGSGYSQGVKFGNTVYVAGQVAVDASGNVVGVGDMTAQTKQTLENVRAILHSSGMDLQDVVTATVYVTDLSLYGEFRAAWMDIFGDHAPARATVRADLVHPQLLVEIQATASR